MVKSICTVVPMERTTNVAISYLCIAVLVGMAAAEAWQVLRAAWHCISTRTAAPLCAYFSAGENVIDWAIIVLGAGTVEASTVGQGISFPGLTGRGCRPWAAGGVHARSDRHGTCLCSTPTCTPQRGRASSSCSSRVAICSDAYANVQAESQARELAGDFHTTHMLLLGPERLGRAAAHLEGLGKGAGLPEARGLLSSGCSKSCKRRGSLRGGCRATL